MNHLRVYEKLVRRKPVKLDEFGRITRIENHHIHHITPRHVGGDDDPQNLCHLTVREHVLAHRLLWKMYGHVNDLRAMSMLGANLSVEYRRIIGEWCRDNKIGMFSEKYDEIRSEWRARSTETRMRNQSGIYNRNSPDYKIWKSNAGKQSAKVQMRDKIGIFSPESRKKQATLSKIRMTGTVWMTKNKENRQVDKKTARTLEEEGWAKGRFIPKREGPGWSKGKKWMSHSDGSRKQVDPSEVETFLSNGWVMGKSSF